MSERLTWDQEGQRLYETGVKNGVLYPYDSNAVDKTKAYGPGVAWNGLTGITESPSGAEATSLYADDTKYLTLLSTEEFGATVEAYMYPDEFGECDGSAEIMPGVTAGQQDRKTFGMCYRTANGNDILGDAYGYKLHLIYGAKATPSEKNYATVNDSPEAASLSWTINTTPVDVPGLKKTASIVIDSTKVSKKAMEALEKVLYGSDEADAYLPLPAEIKTIIETANAAG